VTKPKVAEAHACPSEEVETKEPRVGIRITGNKPLSIRPKDALGSMRLSTSTGEKR